MQRLHRTAALITLVTTLVSAGAQAEPAPVPDLESRIKSYQADYQGPMPDAAGQRLMQQAGADLAAAMPNPGLKVGAMAPDFELPNAHGKPVQLSKALAKGPVILSFYRGAWCPYCNLELKALKESLPQFERYNASLIAVTPQTPDRSLEQVNKDGYPFEILSDLGDLVTKAYGLYFEVPDELHNMYVNTFGLDITRFNGPGRMGLPVPGTFVIDQQGIVRAAFADTDYKKRMEPQAIIDALASLKR